MKQLSRITLTRRTLKAAIPRISEKLYRGKEPFGIFILGGDIRLVRVSTALFAQEHRRACVLNNFVGIYDGRADVAGIREDMEMFLR
ncbi:MAG: hypothetical protein IT497_05145 [Ottowia sp.]|nr:hypothetical protein [Ottowia sp.]